MAEPGIGRGKLIGCVFVPFVFELSFCSSNAVEDEYENAIDRTPFSLASRPDRGSIKATEAYDRKSIVRTDRT
jgi:hypothetical protein